MVGCKRPHRQGYLRGSRYFCFCIQFMVFIHGRLHFFLFLRNKARGRSHLYVCHYSPIVELLVNFINSWTFLDLIAVIRISVGGWHQERGATI